jgi:hypothetical protein
MLTWLNVFVNNLAYPLFWFAVVGSVVFLGIAIFSLVERSHKAYGSVGYAVAQRRFWHCARSAVGLVVIYSVVAAVPKADYQVQIKEVPVDRIVPKVEYKIPNTQDGTVQVDVKTN